ncbi:signal recognition particle-docking protein FtsY [Hymenobacter sp. YC55]|uniref:signal recognition particle-docking protein FtsY n=1 Tax=Hymenobacter sp. YC55 TaxID=3034019 RepID=UPI0023F75D3C|nr:signal recognition particle-docking protein FtsY [Hymenobacter sp. YC55]MDF7814312.1 signal recognition particle-docking protein FtsY [Hymenobacter sp. YC55]
MGLFDFFKKDKENKEQQESLDKGLEKTKTSFFDQLSKAVVGKATVDEAVLDDLETLLVHADVGIDTTVKVIDRIEKRVARDKYVSTSELDRILREEIVDLLQDNRTSGSSAILDRPDSPGQPFVIMVVGVNGVGKTTTIGKLAHRFHSAGKKVVLGAADTFRAAAVDQLIIWGQRVGVPVISHGMNTDPASVAYDAIKQGVDLGADVVIIDTAGRLHNKVNLMNELNKIKRVMQKVIPDAPHEVLLVLDGSTGQNAFLQAKEFTKATEVSALAITKLDGTAKGGVVIGISDQLQVPVRYIGVGEKMTDLQLFDRRTFVNSLFKK